MNPYAIIAAIVFAAGLFGTGVSVGIKHERGAEALRINEAAVAAADKARADAALESDRALADAKATASRRAAAREKTHQLELEIARDESARKCRISDGTLSVLSQSITAANTTPAEAGPAGVPAAAPAGRSDGFRPSTLDWRRGFGLWGVQTKSQTSNGLDSK